MDSFDFMYCPVDALVGNYVQDRVTIFPKMLFRIVLASPECPDFALLIGNHYNPDDQSDSSSHLLYSL